MTKRRKTAVVVALIACVALAGYLHAVWPSLVRRPVGPSRGDLPHLVEGRSEPTTGQFVGHTEASIVERFGPATHHWQGYYGAPPVSYQQTYPDAVTITYERPKGTLYLSFCKEQGRFVCFSSDWMPLGCVF